MENYKNLSGNSGVEQFEIGKNYIIVKFKDNEYLYYYTDRNPGITDVNTMIRLARSGKGLSTYISQHVKKNYDRKAKI